MEKLMLCSKGLHDKDVSEKCNIIYTNEEIINDLKAKLEHFEKQTRPVDILANNTNEHVYNICSLNYRLTMSVSIFNIGIPNNDTLEIAKGSLFRKYIEDTLFEFSNDTEWSKSKATLFISSFYLILYSIMQTDIASTTNINEIIFNYVNEYLDNENNNGILNDNVNGALFWITCEDNDTNSIEPLHNNALLWEYMYGMKIYDVCEWCEGSTCGMY